MGYFDEKGYVSNSELGALQYAMTGQEQKDLSPYYNFGTLIDALVTEPHRVNYDLRMVDNLVFSKEEWDTASAMMQAANKDPMLTAFCKLSDKQAEVYNKEFECEWQGYSFTIPAKCKFDFLIKKMNMAGDLKSTACTTYLSFLAAIEMFNYDRQAAWYMDLGKVDTFVIIGVSKKRDKFGNHNVMKHVIKRDDKMYRAGREKYSRLSFNYKNLILNLNI